MALAATLLLLTVAASSAARPKSYNRFKARKIAGEAMDLYEAGDFAAALSKFIKADDLYPTTTLKLRVARCLDKLDRMREAAEKYREVIAIELKPWAPKAHKRARKKAIPELSTLLEQTPAITVIITGPGSEAATLNMEGAPLPTELLGKKQQMDPGIYLFKATAGERTVSKRVALKRGKHKRVALKLPPETVDEVPAPAVSPAMKIAGWTAVGVGGAGLIIGVIAGAVVLNEESDLLERCGEDRTCPPQVHDDARSFDTARNVSTAGFVIAAAGAVAGTTLLLLAPGDGPENQPDEAHVRPFFWPGGAGISGSF